MKLAPVLTVTGSVVCLAGIYLLLGLPVALIFAGVITALAGLFLVPAK